MQDEIGEAMQKQCDGDQPERRFAPAAAAAGTSAIANPATQASPHDARTRQSYRLGSPDDRPLPSAGFEKG